MTEPIIKSKLMLLHDYLRRLDQLATLPEDKASKDYILQSAIERYLHLTIECLTAIAAHLVKKRSLPTPTKRSEVYTLLCDNGVLPADYRDHLVRMVKFRNLLVHGYATVKFSAVWRILQEERDFLKKVANILTKVFGES